MSTHVEPAYTDDAIVGWQSNQRGGGLLRSRIPTGVINEMGAQDGQYFHYEVYDKPTTVKIEPGTIIMWVINAEDANPRNLIEEKKAAKAAKPATQRASKKASKKGAAVLDDIFGEEDIFGEDDEVDDGSEPAPAPAPRRTAAAPAAIVQRRPSTPARSAPTGTPTREAQRAVSRIAQRPSTAPIAAGRSAKPIGAPIPKPGQARRAGGVRYQNLPE